jgi:hypothetical protein
MKAKLLMIIGIVFALIPTLAYGLPFFSVEYEFDSADYVVIGKILSIEILSEPKITTDPISIHTGVALYKVKVEEYLKNIRDEEMITVTGNFIRERSTLTYATFPFEVDQGVLLYVTEYDGYDDTNLTFNSKTSKVISDVLCDSDTIFVKGMCIESDKLIEKQIVSDSCPVIHFLNYAWQDCGTVWTWSVLGIPLLAIIAAPIGIILAFVIWRVRK